MPACFQKVDSWAECGRVEGYTKQFYRLQNKKWIKYKYFYQINGKNWIFGIYKNEDFSLFSLPNHIDMRFFKLIPPN